MLITPTGMGADDLRPQDMVWVGLDGTVHGDWQPSSEWHFHQAIYARAARPAGRRAHATRCMPPRWPAWSAPLPAFHYMVAVAGGDSVPLRAVPPVRHRGAVGGGGAGAAPTATPACWPTTAWWPPAATLAQAMKVVIEIESLCEVYLKALAVAEPRCLNAEEMAQVIEKFKHYGRARRT